MTRHAIARARERYDVDLTEEDMGKLEDDIREGRTLFLGRETKKPWKERHVVRHNATHMLAGYDRATDAIFTFLPADNMGPGGAKRAAQAAAKKVGRNPTRRRRKRGKGAYRKRDPGFQRAGNKKPPP